MIRVQVRTCTQPFSTVSIRSTKIYSLEKSTDKPNTSNICIGPSNASFSFSKNEQKYVHGNKPINCLFGKPFKTPGDNYLCVVNMTDI